MLKGKLAMGLCVGPDGRPDGVRIVVSAGSEG
jgi:outer membrane biosynthesis protein TonB